MSDESYLDKKYFIDDDKYNCPFCNRRSIVYSVISKDFVDWSEERKVYLYRIKCGGCGKISLHFSDYDFTILNLGKLINFSHKPYNAEKDKVENYSPENLDSYFFYHQPKSSFTINSLIPKKIRDLVSESEGCKKMNYLVGASGALRKAIYEFLENQKAEGERYQFKIKWLKEKYPQIDGSYFDALSNIQGMTSDNLHEKDGFWEPWSNDDLNYLIEVVKAVLDEVYVEPIKRRKIIDRISKMKSKSGFTSNKKRTS